MSAIQINFTIYQENHDLISDMAKEQSTEAAALPKLLLDLIEQVEGAKGNQKRVEGETNGTDYDAERKEDDLQQEDIAHNLPKVTASRKINVHGIQFHIVLTLYLDISYHRCGAFCWNY